MTDGSTAVARSCIILNVVNSNSFQKQKKKMKLSVRTNRFASRSQLPGYNSESRYIVGKVSNYKFPVVFNPRCV